MTLRRLAEPDPAASPEVAPAVQDVVLGQDQAVAVDPVGEGDRGAAARVVVDLAQVEARRALVVDDPAVLEVEAALHLEVVVRGVEGDLQDAVLVAADEEADLLVARVEETVEADLERLERRGVDDDVARAVG